MMEKMCALRDCLFPLGTKVESTEEGHEGPQPILPACLCLHAHRQPHSPNPGPRTSAHTGCAVNPPEEQIHSEMRY